MALNAGASEWVPSFKMKPVMIEIRPTVVSTPPVSPTVINLPGENSSQISGSNDNDCCHQSSGDDDNNASEEIDERDPLWIAVLQISEGNREAAKKLISDPDSLDQYPQIQEILRNCNDNADVTIPELEIAGTDYDDAKAADDGQGDVSSGAGVEAVETDSDPREHMNVVFIGHVDAGKSTLSGNILYLTGQVDRRTIEKYEREAKARNRESWFLAYIMDTSEEERARGKTVEVGLAHFHTPAKRYTILDAPGHKLYIPNMIMGACQADIGILVIAARRGEFETGFEKGGQTREHAILAKTLGIKYLVVAINKMDDETVLWDKVRYDECVAKLRPFLKSCGYAIKRDVHFMPISALHGDNIIVEVSSDLCPWWSSEHETRPGTLLSLLDSLAIPSRDAATPALRVPVLARYMEQGLCVVGKVEAGTVRLHDEVIFAPSNYRARVDKIKIADVLVRQARAGENVVIKFASSGVENIQRGYVLTSVSHPLVPACQLMGQVYLVDMLPHRSVFCEGYLCIVHIHTIESPIECTHIKKVTRNGVEKDSAKIAQLGDMIEAVFRVPQSLAIEVYETRQELGRFTLRDEGKTIGVGKIIKLPRAK